MSSSRSLLASCARAALLAATTLGTAVVTAQPVVFTHLAGGLGGPGWFDGTGSAARFRAPAGITLDGAGNVYVADTSNHTIRKVTPAGAVTTLAGLMGAFGSTDGTGSLALFHYPYGLAVDASANVYVADSVNQAIRKVTPQGVVTTFVGRAGFSGTADGTGTGARFNSPAGVALDGTGNAYVADTYNHTIRKVTPSGVVTTLAGLGGSSGSTDGTGTAARFNLPWGVAADGAGNLLVADYSNSTVRQVTPDGVVTTLAGLAGSNGSADGTGTAARFNKPRGVAVDSMGNVYVIDTNNHAIRKIAPGGAVTTLAGSQGRPGDADGIESAARFYIPFSGAVDGAGNVYVVDTYNFTVRKVTPSGAVTTLAGFPGNSGSADGTGSAARFYTPRGMALDGVGNLYVADNTNHTIRKITPAGVVTTLAGLAGSSGSADGTGSAARFYYPYGVAVDAQGGLTVTDTGNTIRKVTPSGVVTTLAGLAGASGSADGSGSAARFNGPTGVAPDGAGNAYVADWGNHTIRKVTPAGAVTTLAGLAGASGSADGTGSAARFNEPAGVALDGAGNLLVTDYVNHTIRSVTPGGAVTTLAGRAGINGTADGTGSAARFYYPIGLAVDGSGSIYVADQSNSTIRKITPAGVVTTVAGSGGVEGSLDGIGTVARFYYPWDVAVDAGGNVFVSDAANNAIRKGSPALADAATIDAPSGRTGASRILGSSPQTASSWLWDVVRRPGDSTASLSSATAASPTFIADRAGLYTFRLTATAANGQQSITYVDLAASADPASLELSTGRIRAGVRWRNPYSGESGTATAIPKGDAFGYFFFSDAHNPEVFTKALDFGADRAYLLFWAGLTDFEYTVTFTNEATNRTYSSTKPAYSTDGGFDTQSLPHVRAVLWEPESGTARDLADWEWIGLVRERESVRAPEPKAASDLLLAGGQVSVSVAWRSQYSGQTGTATPLPQDDQFGFFYFSDAGNPEVFVKVLDWGTERPFLLFAAGLTDFEYTVTYRNVRTGQQVSFTKPAGGYGGYADGTSMGH